MRTRSAASVDLDRLAAGGLARRLALADREEFGQAVLRVTIAGLILIGFLAYGIGSALGLWHGALAERQERALGFAVVYFVIALATVFHVLATRGPSAGRRYAGIAMDVAGITYFMLVAGEIGAAVVAVYLFVTIGNGFRFGRRYLLVAQVLSLAGFTVVSAYSEFWSRNPWVVAGTYVTLLAIPMYVAIMSARLEVALRHARTALDARPAA